MNSREAKPKACLAATLNRHEGSSVVIRFADGQELYWNKDNLAKNVHLGDKIFVLLRTQEENSIGTKELAKNILEHIINGKP